MAGAILQFGDPDRPSYFFEDPDDLDGPVLPTMLTYWRKGRRDGDLPVSSEFRPKDVKTLLPWIVVIDALPELSDYRYRVIGSRVCEYFLADGTGKTVREAFAALPILAEQIIGAYRRTCMLRVPTRSTGPAMVVDGIYFPAYDSLYLPYSSDGRVADRVINAFSFSYDEVRAKRAYSAASMSPLSTRSLPLD